MNDTETSKEKMDRILIMAQYRLYPITSGAIVRVVEETKFLSEQGFEVHLAGSWTNKEGIKRIKEITHSQVHTYAISLVRGAILLILVRISKSLTRKFSDPFLYWFNPLVKYDFARIIKKVKPQLIQCEFLPLIYHLSKIARKYNIPLVLSEHNVEFVRLPKKWTAGAHRQEQIKRVERDLCNSADFVTTMSEEDKRKLREIGVTKPIEITPNGVSYERYQVREEVREEMRRSYGIEREDVVLVYHGTLGYLPNVEANELLIDYIFPELSKRYENLKLLLLGPGHPREIGEKIIQLPAVPFGELPKHLSMADIAVVPLTAGSGTRLKIVEYLALGIPTVSTEIGAEGLHVTNGRDIIIAKDAKEDFVKKTSNLLEDKELQQKLRGNGRITARKMDWSSVFQKYLEIYEKLLCVGEKE